MAATTPYQNNDYTAVSNYRPYSLPVNDIFKAISAQNEFWNQGAQRVKSVHDNALNLKLSLEPNREIRKKFMEEAEKQLTKLSSMDLSDPSVQRQGFSIFKPLFEDVGVMSDDQSTRWIEQVQGDIQRARQNGKDYADSNAMVAMEGVYEFKTSKDRFAGKGYLENKKSYTPYYDPSKEMSDILKNCKGPTISGTSPGGATEMYLHTQEVSGASPTRLKNCLTAALSQRAKDQVGIDGYASYMSMNRVDNPEGKNYRALRDDYVVYNKSAMDGINQEIKDIDGKILSFQSNYNATKDRKWLDMKKAAEEAKAQYLDQGKNLADTFANVSAGNLDFIKKNYGTLSEQLYTNKQLGTFAQAFSNESTTDKYSADAVKLQNQRLVYDAEKTLSGREHDKVMAEIDYQNDLQIEALKGSFKGKKIGPNGELIDVLIPTSPAYTEKDKQSVGYNEFQKQKIDLSSKIDAENEELFNRLQSDFPKELQGYTKETFFQEGPNGISAGLSYLDTQGKSGTKNPAVEQWKKKTATLQNQLTVWNETEKINETEINVKAPKLKDLSTIKERFTVGGYDLSAQDVQDAIQNKNPLVGVKINTGYGPYGGKTSYNTFFDRRTGQTIADQESGTNWEPMRNVLGQLDKRASSIGKIRDDVYGRSVLAIRPGVYASANNADKDDRTRIDIQAAVDLKLPIDNIKILEMDPLTGRATISIKGEGKKVPSASFIKERLSGLMQVDESRSFSKGEDEVVLEIISPHLVKEELLQNPLTVVQMALDKISISLTNSESPYAKYRPGQVIIEKMPIVTDKVDANVKVRRTTSGIEYDVQTKDSKTGMYKNTPAVGISSTNELLEYINKISQMSK